MEENQQTSVENQLRELVELTMSLENRLNSIVRVRD